MISVIMPFWCRSQALQVNLAQYRKLYPSLDIEVIIVDDGSPEGTGMLDGFPWAVRRIRLPAKTAALNPCVPYNSGVRAARGDTIVLTNPEVVHRAPILETMRDGLGERSYIAAACWSPARKKWYCHSSYRYKTPANAGLHFCAMLPRALYDEVGGFCEEYRFGQAFEDVDFLWKLHIAGTNCVIADELVTDHLKTTRPVWPYGGLDRNRIIFESRWGDPPGSRKVDIGC